MRDTENNNPLLGGRVEAGIQILILFSLLTFTIETIPSLKPSTALFLEKLEVIFVLIFTVEYLLRFYLARKKMAFVFSFYSIVDLVAIVPFYIMSGLDLRALRIIRMMRVFRMLKLLRYSKAIKRFEKALRLIKEELIMFLSATCILLYLAGVGIYYCERLAQPEVFASVFHSLWWAVVTLTTVGYGDAYPITVGGKILTFFMLIIGLGIVAVPTSLLSSALTEARQK